ncbi:MAG TPA: Clp protease N-terminal domain-containing protein [Candidatus Limnocylindria bacterium]
MSDVLIAGAIAGAVAGAIAGLVAFLVLRRAEPRPGQWRSFTARSNVVRQRHQYVPATVAGTSFDDFDESGKRVIAIAQEEAIRLNHNYIGTEHLLAAVVRADTDGPAGRALARLGVSLDKVRTALEFIIGKGDAPVVPATITISPRSQTVLALARDEAHRMGRTKVGAAEILLALLREGQGIAAGILESLALTLDKVREAVLSELGTGLRSPSPGTPPPQPPPPRGDVRTHRGAGGGPFDRFNDRAKRVLALAQDEAIRFNHNYMGPEHLLLGLVREGEGVAARVLKRLGVELSTVRGEVVKAIGRGESTASPSEITLIPRTKRVIEFAIDESRLLGHSHVGTEHLLLGLVRDDGSIACGILKSHGATLEKIRAQVIAMLDEPDPS